MATVDTIACPAAAASGPRGLRGWLILPIIGLFLTPVRGIAVLMPTYSNIGESLPYLTASQRILIYVEIAMNVAIMAIAPLVLLVVLFLKRRVFKYWYVTWAIASPVWILHDLWLVAVFFPDASSFETLFDEETFSEFSRSFMQAIIWVPYMLISRRVANTFVN